MTDGHRHHTITVGSPTLLRILTWPLATTRDRSRAEDSRWTWRDAGTGVYTLSPLGILHTLTGLTVRVRP